MSGKMRSTSVTTPVTAKPEGYLMQALSTVLSPGQMGVRPTAAAREAREEAQLRLRRERIAVDVKCILRAGFWLLVVLVVVVRLELEFISGRGR
jgi:8-oxo-dGTP pyrophosphatase MutT (NUDIX family)